MSSPRAKTTPLGPPCSCGLPTVLRELNGRNVFVCAQYPRHHCRACCPADIMLFGDSVPSQQQQQATAETTPSPPATSRVESPPPQQQQPQQQQPDNNDAVNDTTPSGRTLSAPVCPPSAPSKSTSVTSRASRSSHNSGAVRSLTPVFNGFAAAAARASQLGGHYAVLRPHVASIAKMQRKMSGYAEAATPGEQPDSTRKRRHRSPGVAAAAAAPSVQTVSRGREPRVTTWIRSPDAAKQ